MNNLQNLPEQITSQLSSPPQGVGFDPIPDVMIAAPAASGSLGLVRVGDRTFSVGTAPPIAPVERITQEENRKRRSKGKSSPTSPETNRLAALESQVQALVAALAGSGTAQASPITVPSPQTPTAIDRYEDEDPFEPDAEPEQPQIPDMTSKVLSWMGAKDLLKGFKRQLQGVHKRVRFDEWSDEFRGVFHEKFEQFAGDEKFVRRVTNVVRSFPDGNVMDEGGIGSFAAVLAGYLAMYCAFTDIAKQQEGQS